MRIEFRPISSTDVPNLTRWQKEPEVDVWWASNGERTFDEVFQKWERRTEEIFTDGSDKTQRYVIVVDGTGIGEIQGYRLSDYPEHAAEVGIPNAAGVDVFIGEPAWRNRGVGTLVIKQFIEEVIWNLPGVDVCTIDPDPENKRAIRSYEKVGFSYVRSYYSVVNEMNVYLMRMEKPEAVTSS